MKHVLTIDAEVPPESGVLLLAITMALCRRRLRPGSFVWTTIDETPDVRLRIELEEDESLVRELAEECRSLCGASFVTLHRPDQAAVLVARAAQAPPPNAGQALPLSGGTPP